MTAVYYALSCVLGYLLGSISISILISRHVFHQDVRQSGSGNAGATNVARVFGLGAGVLTFLGDFAKTLLAAWLGSLLGGVIGSCLGAAFALIGHCFPVYYRFRGGKAVSAGAAAALVIDWRIFVLAVAVFALAALLSKTASVSSMSAAGMVAVGTILFAPSTAQLSRNSIPATGTENKPQSRNMQMPPFRAAFVQLRYSVGSTGVLPE